MNKIDALRCELKCREMVEGTGLEWWQVVKLMGREWGYGRTPDFSCDENNYEFALGVVEGKPVWKGDELYLIARGDRKTIVSKHPNFDSIQWNDEVNGLTGMPLSSWTWKPPAPKTIMLELPIEYVEWIAAGVISSPSAIDVIVGSCKKALESAKCK